MSSTAQNIKSNLATSLGPIQIKLLHNAHSFEKINVDHCSNITENHVNTHSYMVANNAKRLWVEPDNYNNYKHSSLQRSWHGPPQLSPVNAFSQKNDLVYNRGQKRILPSNDHGPGRHEIDSTERINYDNEMNKYPRKRFKSDLDIHQSECEDHLELSNSRLVSKEHLNNRILKIEREICSLEANLGKLQTVQDELHKGRRSVTEEIEHPIPYLNLESRPISIARHIYEENSIKAKQSHSSLLKNYKHQDSTTLLYSQPCDTEIFKKNHNKFVSFKKVLVAFLAKRRQAENIRIRYLSERYNQLQQQWAKKMEKKENSALRKDKDSKYRESFERVFPELKKLKDENEKIQRFTATQSVRPPLYARSEVFFEEIVSGLREQELKGQRMRSLSVMPPLLLDSRRRGMRFIDESRLLRMDEICISSVPRLRDWLVTDQDTFVEKFAQNPKKFHLIASHFKNKTVQDCVWFYYITKKDANYKQIVRRFQKEQKKKRSVPDLSSICKELSPNISNVNEESLNNIDNKECQFKIEDQDSQENKNEILEPKVEAEDQISVTKIVEENMQCEESDAKPQHNTANSLSAILSTAQDDKNTVETQEEDSFSANQSTSSKVIDIIEFKTEVEDQKTDDFTSDIPVSNVGKQTNANNVMSMYEKTPIPANTSIQKLMNNTLLKEGGYVIPSLEDVSDTDSVATDTADEGDDDSPTRRGKQQAKHQGPVEASSLAHNQGPGTSSKKPIIRDLIHAIIEGNLQNDKRNTAEFTTANKIMMTMAEERQISMNKSPSRYLDQNVVLRMTPHNQTTASPHQRPINQSPHISTPHLMPPSPKMMQETCKVFQHHNSDDPLNQLATVALQIGPIVCHNDSKKIVPPIACRGSITHGTSGNINKMHAQSMKQYLPSLNHQAPATHESHLKLFANKPPTKYSDTLDIHASKLSSKHADTADMLRNDFRTALQMKQGVGNEGGGRGMHVGFEPQRLSLQPTHHHLDASLAQHYSKFEYDNNSTKIHNSFKKSLLDSVVKASVASGASNGSLPKLTSAAPHITAANLIEAIIAMQINQADASNKDVQPLLQQAKSSNGGDNHLEMYGAAAHSILERIDSSGTRRSKHNDPPLSVCPRSYIEAENHGSNHLQSIDSKIHEFLPDRSYMATVERTYMSASERNYLSQNDRPYLPANDRLNVTSAAEHKFKTASERINAIIEQGIVQPKTASDRINAIIEQGTGHSVSGSMFNSQMFRSHAPPIPPTYVHAKNNFQRPASLHHAAEVMENSYQCFPPQIRYSQALNMVKSGVMFSGRSVDSQRIMQEQSSGGRRGSFMLPVRDAHLHNASFAATEMAQIAQRGSPLERCISPSNKMTASDRINAIIKEGLVNQDEQQRCSNGADKSIQINTSRANLSPNKISIISFRPDNSKPTSTYLRLPQNENLMPKHIASKDDEAVNESISTWDSPMRREETPTEKQEGGSVRVEPAVSKNFSWKSKMLRQHEETLVVQEDGDLETDETIAGVHSIKDILSKNDLSSDAAVCSNVPASKLDAEAGNTREEDKIENKLKTLDKRCLVEKLVDEDDGASHSLKVAEEDKIQPIATEMASVDEVNSSAYVSQECLPTSGVSVCDRSPSVNSSCSSNDHLRIDLNN